MKTAAIICEYNPFHNGHLYQINKIKEQLDAENIICLMSPDFVQRGEPAVVNKHIRSSFALEAGASVVLSMPVSIATASAELFAYSSVSMLNRLGTVNYLVFGAECDSLDTLTNVANELLTKASIDSPEIKVLLKEGYTYARARSTIMPQYDEILSKPNNILAIEYIKALLQLKSDIKPVLIKREGSGYNDSSIPEGSSFASATALRAAILNDEKETVKIHVPSYVYDRLSTEPIANLNDLSDMLLYKLLSEDSYSDYFEISGDLSDKIKKNLCNYHSFEQFIDLLKSKDLTRARISRGLLHILLNIKGTITERKALIDNISHIRMLSLNRQASSFIKETAKCGSIRLISSVTDNESGFNNSDKILFSEDLFASRLYSSVIAANNNLSAIHDYSRPIITK